MALNYQPGGDTSTGGTRLTEPGTYHLVVTEVTETPTKKDGSLISNAAFGVTVGVLDGTTPGQKEKNVNILFFHGKPGEEKSEAFAKKKMDRFFMAVCILTPQQIEAKAKVSINLADAVGRQLVAKFDKEKPEQSYVDLSFADIYHVDDPAVKDIPKCKLSLGLIQPSLRWPGGQSPGASTKTSAVSAPSSNGNGSAAAAPAQPTTSFDDL